MGFKCGIVGLPNVGKSTLFSALTSAKAEIANYPFCTIDPNVGIVKVPDSRLAKIVEIIPTQSIIPASMEFVDIAGLVRGASKGEGLGNQFLAHIREVNAVAHVVRCFADGNIHHVEESINPVRDIETIETELQLADLDTVDRRLQNLGRLSKSGSPEAKEQLAIAERIKVGLSAGRSVRTLALTEEQQLQIRDLHLLTAKPILYVCNVGEEDLTTSAGDLPLVKLVADRAAKEGARSIIVCGKVEAELADMSEVDRPLFLEEMGVGESGLVRLIRTGYELLKLITYFTAGPKEVRAWTIERGWRAPQAAGRIHSDFEKGFIRAEVYHVDELIRAKSEAAIRSMGLLRLEGKDYVVKDGDVMHFRFNT